ncbi:hypothetical protein [Daejeonella oryzae]|uniref:hypothetical protein n=1 Tax=Daejeonella oryzae TaxID=1122943 RepID=UPI00041D0070|nr:hypothetical protein [Daejeonella oryzae]
MTETSKFYQDLNEGQKKVAPKVAELLVGLSISEAEELLRMVARSLGEIKVR